MARALPPSSPTTAFAPVPSVGGSRHLPTLDGWRAVAITLVLVCHARPSVGEAFGLPGTLLSKSFFGRMGILGVQIFFGLSGFLITSRLIDEEGRFGRISLRGFYVRRAFRILPAAYAFLAVVGALALAGAISVPFDRWLAALLCYANYATGPGSWYVGHFWSLSIEEHFYLLWPAAFLLLVTTRRRALVAAVMGLVVVAWRVLDFRYAIAGSMGETFWGRTDTQADGLLWGCVVALLHADPEWRPRLARAVGSPAAQAALLAAVFLLSALSPMRWKPLTQGLESLAIPFLLLATVIASRGILGRLLESAAFRWVGRRSYGIYLWQELFLTPLEDRAPTLHALQSFPVNLVLAIACAASSHAILERPLTALGQRLSARVRSQER